MVKPTNAFISSTLFIQGVGGGSLEDSMEQCEVKRLVSAITSSRSSGSEKPEKNSSRILVHGEGGTNDLGEGSNVHWGT